jgi:hypothetical protein
MQKHERKAKRMFEKAGIKVIRIGHTGNAHAVFTVEHNGVAKKVVCSSSPKSSDAMLHSISNEIRAILRSEVSRKELGRLRGESQPASCLEGDNTLPGKSPI